MSQLAFSIVQNIFQAPHPPISVTACPRVALTRTILQDFLDTVDDGIIGVAPAYGANCVLSVLAFASATNVLLVPTVTSWKNMPIPSKASSRGHFSSTQGDVLEDFILCPNTYSKIAFQMDVLATSLYHDLKLRIRGGVDLLSIALHISRRSLDSIMNSIGGEAILFKPNVIALFSGEEKLEETPLHHVALQAWVAWRAATLPQIALRLCQEPRIDTMLLTEARLSVFSKLVRDASRLSALKPTSVDNEIAEEYDYSDGHLHVLSTRFQNRVRVGGQPIEIQGIASGQQITVLGRATRADGRAARIQVDVPFDGLIKVTTVGKDRLTTSEQQREKIVLNALQSTSTITEQPFFQAIWLPRETSPYPARRLSTCEIPMYLSRRLLNDSQTRAVEAILSAQHIDVIHGPPGTGKTTVIAAAVTSMVGYPERTIWITAQSNVAVKNVAEKLAASDFWDFKILVSQEFHHDWHEHLYEKINGNLIKSEEFINDLVATEQQLMGSRVILCTLSMLSSLRISAITRLVPLETVIVDEASQVEIGNFIPMISRFSKSLRKIVFIGDDKQLAPYGHDDISDLQSVFEMRHLREGAIFLDTQCTMPTQLGDFIGRHVYSNKLKTIHHDASQCCHFINVKKGKEISKGLSWVNLAEVGATVAQARKLHARGQSYRIITPYDAQRAMIETALKASKPEVPWQDTVFCVDSFQGNEADWIIVSVVRTEKIGFLAEKRRVNVMLTRCKKGMKICTSRPFVEGTAKNTLIGLLASEIGPTAWER